MPKRKGKVSTAKAKKTAVAPPADLVAHQNHELDWVRAKRWGEISEPRKRTYLIARAKNPTQRAALIESGVHVWELASWREDDSKFASEEELAVDFSSDVWMDRIYARVFDAEKPSDYLLGKIADQILSKRFGAKPENQRATAAPTIVQVHVDASHLPREARTVDATPKADTPAKLVSPHETPVPEPVEPEPVKTFLEGPGK